jgi:hypothetical protein
MSKRGPSSIAKRQREKDQKRTADEKRSRRAERKIAGPQEPEFIIHKPILDEDQV